MPSQALVRLGDDSRAARWALKYRRAAFMTSSVHKTAHFSTLHLETRGCAAIGQFFVCCRSPLAEPRTGAAAPNNLHVVIFSIETSGCQWALDGAERSPSGGAVQRFATNLIPMFFLSLDPFGVRLKAPGHTAGQLVPPSVTPSHSERALNPVAKQPVEFSQNDGGAKCTLVFSRCS